MKRVLKSDHFGIETADNPVSGYLFFLLKSDHFGIETAPH